MSIFLWSTRRTTVIVIINTNKGDEELNMLLCKDQRKENISRSSKRKNNKTKPKNNQLKCCLSDPK